MYKKITNFFCENKRIDRSFLIVNNSYLFNLNLYKKAGKKFI